MKLAFRYPPNLAAGLGIDAWCTSPPRPFHARCSRTHPQALNWKSISRRRRSHFYYLPEGPVHVTLASADDSGKAVWTRVQATGDRKSQPADSPRAVPSPAFPGQVKGKNLNAGLRKEIKISLEAVDAARGLRKKTLRIRTRAVLERNFQRLFKHQNPNPQTPRGTKPKSQISPGR